MYKNQHAKIKHNLSSKMKHFITTIYGTNSYDLRQFLQKFMWKCG